MLQTRHNSNAVKRVAVLFFLIAVFTLPARSQSGPPPSRVLVEGEELTYNVRYGFIDLGQVKIKTMKKVKYSGVDVYQTIAYIDSYKKIPFVDLHAVFASNIDSAVFSHFFLGKSKDGDNWDFGRYRYDYGKKVVFLESGSRDTIVQKRDTLKIDGSTQDGLSLFFFARDQLYSSRTQTIPAIVKEKKVNTMIDFVGKRRSLEYDLVDYPVDVIGFEGEMEFTGIFGLTGDFEGWFSNDEARVPILAKMKVILGSVTIELMAWNRPGWKPPKG
jgi:hypothetical protein